MKTYPRYSVQPFSLWTDKTRSKDIEGSTPCAICGRPVKDDNQKATWVTVVNGGDDWAKNEYEANNVNDDGFMGGWPVGPDCHKKYLIKQEA